MTSRCRRRTAAALASLALLAGCYQTQGFIEPEKVDEIKAGVTTARELEAKLGTPTTTVPLGEGRTLWVYEGYFATPSADSYIPYVGLLTGRNNQKCSRLTVVVEDAGRVGILDREGQRSLDARRQHLSALSRAPSARSG